MLNSLFSELEATPDPELIPTPEPIGDLEVTTEKEGLGEEKDQNEIGTYWKGMYGMMVLLF